RVQKTSCGIKADEPRRGTLRRLPSDRVSNPLVASVLSMAMLSWPRLELYTKRPSGVTANSAAVLNPVWQRRDDPRRPQHSILLLPAVGDCRAAELIEHPDHRKLRVERQMARPGAQIRSLGNKLRGDS